MKNIQEILTPQQINQLRLKCLEPYVMTASKVNIEQNVVLAKAEEAWKYAIEPITKEQDETTSGPPSATA